MSYNTNLQNNNISLQGILDTINNLPEAGSGDGTNVETCTITIADSDIEVAYTDENGEVQCLVSEAETSVTCIKNSLVAVGDYSFTTGTIVEGGIALGGDIIFGMYIFIKATENIVVRKRA